MADSAGTIRVETLDFRIQQERAQFEIYEQRRLAIENQATAVSATALAVAALLVSAQDKLSALGESLDKGLLVTIGGLVLVGLLASVSRFGTWTWIKPFGPPLPRLDLRVGETLRALRHPSDVNAPAQLRQLALDHWEARAKSAWRLGLYKLCWLRASLVLMILPLAYFIWVALEVF